MTTAATDRAVRGGHVDWVELTTSSLDNEAAFYKRIFDWHFTSLATLTLAESDGAKVAGLSPRVTTIGDMQMSSTWTIFIRTADLEATMHRALELGGRVIEPPREVPDGWRAAVVADPTGAAFGLVQGSADFGFSTSGDPERPVWCDLMTRDRTEAQRFYTELFGWRPELDPAMDYTRFTLAGEAVAGMVDLSTEAPPEAPAHWLPYFVVDDVESACDRVTEAGGTVSSPPMTVGPAVFATVEDPDGAVFGLLASPNR